MSRTTKSHIALVVPGGIGTGAGNLGVPILERQANLLANDFEVTVFSLFPVNEGYKPENFSIVSIASRNPFLKSIALWWSFRKHHREKRFIAIHAFWILPSGFLAVLLGKLYQVKSVVSVLGGDAVALPEINYGLLRHRIPRALILWTMRNADHPVSLTQLPAKNLYAHGLKRKLEVIPFGTDTTFFSFQRKNFREPIQFLHVGNLIPVKDQETLLRAFKIIQSQVSAKLTIIGEGPLENALKKMVDDLQLNDVVKFILPTSHDQMPLHFSKADVLLHTSLSEGLPAIITEAMSAGLLVCGTRVGLIDDLPECCFGVAVKDHHALGDGVIALLKSPDMVNGKITRARAWSVEHDIYWTVAKTKAIYLS